ncbi:hypothetical protein TrispH2_004823 [Trichoplax sp. H2]|nr:hypothetical protein TrispH2_004823 [Trichoplax sp. H2]|eukprot:RDD42655.1 hypothetical protein TrispH2_004823 [Trichoplax sp. H2]
MSRFQDILTPHDAVLVERGEIGDANAVQLRNAVFWFNSNIFDRKKPQDHANILAEDYKIVKKRYGKQVEFNSFKNRKGQSAAKKRVPDGHHDTGIEYIVDYFEKYLRAIPNHGPFYRKLLSTNSQESESVIRYSDEVMTLADLDELGKWKRHWNKFAQEEVDRTIGSEISDDEILHQLGIISTDDSELLLKAVYWLNYNDLGLLEFKNQQELRKSRLKLITKKGKQFIRLKHDIGATEVQGSVNDLRSKIYIIYMNAVSGFDDTKFYFRPIMDAASKDKTEFSESSLSTSHLRELHKWAKSINDFMKEIRSNSLLPTGCCKITPEIKSKLMEALSSLPIQHNHLSCIISSNDNVNASKRPLSDTRPAKKKK